MVSIPFQRSVLMWLLLAASCTPAGATDVSPAAVANAVDAKSLFGQLDTNRDGTLAVDEVPREKKSLFDRLVRLGDGNADGKLSADEFAVGLAGGAKQTAAPKDAGDAKPMPAKARPGRPGKAARPVPGSFFAVHDKNGDGKLTLDDVPEERRERFSKLIARLDKDGDGAVSKSEIPPAGQAQAASEEPDGTKAAAAIFKRLDANGDGKATADEAPEARREQVARLIRRADQDGDDALSQREFAVVAKRRAQAMKMQSGSHAPQPATAAKKKKPEQVQVTPASLFRAVDRDHDGKLNGEEITGATEAIRSLDKNGDGSITVREISGGQQVAAKKKDAGKKPSPGKKKKGQKNKKAPNPSQPQ
jgi:Ca2+-binding EF-hand superfamily protein